MTDIFDWRLHGVLDVDSVSDDTGRFPPGSKSTLVLFDPVALKDGRSFAMPLPNATAMLLHASQRSYVDAQRLLERAQQRPSGFVHAQNHTEAIDIVEHLMISVFAAYTCLESFANEWIPGWLTYRKTDRTGKSRMISKEEMERVLSLQSKLDQVLPSVFRVKSPKGQSLWEAFVKLEQARNRIVHMKHADREPSEATVDTVWKMLFVLPAPHATAKQLVDWYMRGAPHVPGLTYDKLKPVMPRWFAECPANF